MSKRKTIRTDNKSFRIPDAQLLSCGDIACELLINPIPRPTPASIQVVYKPIARRVLLVHTPKPNSMAVMKAVQRLLRERGITVEDEILTREDAGSPLTQANIDALAHYQGIIVGGINDCGSCSWVGLLDSVTLQRRGLASVGVVTEPFRSQMSRVTAYQQTDRPLPFIVVDHPLMMISPEEIEVRAIQVVEGIERLLEDKMPTNA